MQRQALEVNKKLKGVLWIMAVASVLLFASYLNIHRVVELKQCKTERQNVLDAFDACVDVFKSSEKDWYQAFIKLPLECRQCVFTNSSCDGCYSNFACGITGEA